MSTEGQPLRSFPFAPGNHARRVEKALSLDADAVILDLEDAVATAEKPATREAVAMALQLSRRGCFMSGSMPSTPSSATAT
jgi:citrate lyase beta subunit